MHHLCRDNEPISSAMHLVGAGLAVAALILLVIFATINGTASNVVGTSIFGSSLILLYLTSGTYHFFSKHHPAKLVWQRLDHAMIYVLIAGTYTVLTLALAKTHPGWGWTIFGVNWGLAIVGLLIKAADVRFPPWCFVLMYLVMGWLIALPLPLVFSLLGGRGMFWLVLGGVFYTLGTLAFVLDRHLPRSRWFGMHEVFHLLVLCGSFAHFWMALTSLT